MTHAESQDLLLDLAFGELDAQRAADVEEHLAGCAACREEKAALDEARRLSAPLRAAEEPPPGFDERILEAARAEAHHQHDGNVGKVIEVTGNVRPLGVEAARIDAHAPVKARPAERRRPKWMVRAALGGSVAAAAALALVVSTTLDARRTAERASQAQGEDYRIRVKPAAPEAVDSALHDAAANGELDRGRAAQAKEHEAAAPATESAPPAAVEKKQPGVVDVMQGPPAAALEKQDRVAPVRTPAHNVPAKRAAEMERGREQAADALAPPRDAPSAGARSTVPASSGDKVAPPGVPPAPAPAARPQAAASGQAAGPPAPRDDSQAAPPKLESRMKAVAAAPAAPAPGAAGMEANAQQARHAGDYVLAASLYRQAADLRRRDDDRPSAAWNLAHAVECLAAVARFDEARQVRDELSRLYPGETTALSAARRALREVDVPQPLPASKQK
jgi:hypothetical protein